MKNILSVAMVFRPSELKSFYLIKIKKAYNNEVVGFSLLYEMN